MEHAKPVGSTMLIPYRVARRIECLERMAEFFRRLLGHGKGDEGAFSETGIEKEPEHARKTPFRRVLPLVAAIMVSAASAAEAKESMQHLSAGAKESAASAAACSTQAVDSAKAGKKTVLGMRNEYELTAAWLGLMALIWGGAYVVGQIGDRIRRQREMESEPQVGSETGIEAEMGRFLRRHGGSGI